jgi:hypothetical protein
MMKPGQTRSNPVKPEGNSIDVAQTESNQIKPARMGGIAMMIKIRSGAVTQSWAGFGPVKPSKTQSKPVKPSQTSGVCLFGLNEGCFAEAFGFVRLELYICCKSFVVNNLHH